MPLKLTRKVGQSIIVDGTTEVKVVRSGKTYVHLEINNDKKTKIWRKEVYLKRVESGDEKPLPDYLL